MPEGGALAFGTAGVFTREESSRIQLQEALATLFAASQCLLQRRSGVTLGPCGDHEEPVLARRLFHLAKGLVHHCCSQGTPSLLPSI